ncbi:flavodoxin [Nitrincola tapanii]|uniref:Flavodoxin n=1 Tax=Nitrincola tapanii TaxID=1708751 RepID=A0A5A9W496_9GAMM|nr:flavodoxin [Nitrincola tapanii]KAA0874965.1 flavodoxin [Nitrincola tapanii]
MARFLFLVGSVYGNSSSVAEECSEWLRSRGHAAEVFNTASLQDLASDPEAILMVCTSTTGDGELPDNIYPLYQALREEFPLMPERRYAVIALGDSSYERFADAGKQMDELLTELQARRIGEPLFVDACETADPEGEALAWLKEWMAELEA